MKTILVAFFITITDYGTCQIHYNRSLLQDKYPGFGKEFLFFTDNNTGELIKVYFTQPKNVRFSFEQMFYDIQESVTFTYYSRKYQNGYSSNNIKKIAEFFDKTKVTKFVTHGWMSSGTADTAISIKDEFLKKYDANIFVMDWSPISKNIFYPVPMAATDDVGNYLGKFINYLIDNAGANPKDMHLVGHSLGAHICGFAGKEVTKNKIGRITGLDPALPGFYGDDAGRLSNTDADFVDVIHTCAGFLGYDLPIGHADFYPNGGAVPQPGCGLLEVCSHGRSWRLFSRSIMSNIPYKARKCPNYEVMKYYYEDCNGYEETMGDSVSLDANGVYYVKTINEYPAE